MILKVLIFALIYKPLEHLVFFFFYSVLDIVICTSPYSESSLFKDASVTVLPGTSLLHKTFELYYPCHLLAF